MSFPCPTKNRCPGNDDPLANLSAEDYDQQYYYALIYGDHWRGRCCNFVCTSFVSQEDADLCAAATALVANQGGCGVVQHPDGTIACSNPAIDPGSGNGGDPTEPGAENPSCPDCNPPVEYNEADTLSVPQRTCPGGWVYQYLIAAGQYAGRSLAEANRIARSYAERKADLDRFCCTPSVMMFCLNTAGSHVLTLNGGVGPFSWTVEGLPAGLALEPVNADYSSVRITGTPTAAGLTAVTATITNSNGNYLTGLFEIAVVDFSPASLPDATSGIFYDQQLSLTGLPADTEVTYEIILGSAPTNMTVTAMGRVIGTPTGGFPATFTVEATTAYGSCSKEYTIAQTATPPEPYLWYKMEEASGNRLSQANPLNTHLEPFTEVDATVTQVSGKVGNAVRLLNGLVGLGFAQLYNSAGSVLTLEREIGMSGALWVKWEQAIEPLLWFQIPTVQCSSGEYLHCQLYNGNLTVGWDQVSGAVIIPPLARIDVPFSPVLGQWYFIYFQWDGVSKKCGVRINDGALFESVGTYDIGAADRFARLWLQNGNDSDTRNQPINIDELAIWMRPLSEAETDLLYNNGDGRTYPYS